MSIDPTKENLLRFTEAARDRLLLHAGKGVHVSTLHRWRSVGVCGVKLETLMAGGIRVTSREALARFMARVTAARESASGGNPEPAASHRAAEDANRELEQAGF